MNTLTLTSPCADDPASDGYRHVEAAMRYVAEHWQHRPSLSELAARQGLSEAHFQRLFTRLAGVSPKQFLAALTLPRVLQALAEGRSVLDATFDAGLSSPSRTHELVVHALGLTPQQFRQQGRGRVLRYAVLPTRLGPCFIATSELGLTALAFQDEATDALATNEAQDGWLRTQMARFAAATWQEDTDGLRPLLQRILGPLHLLPDATLKRDTKHPLSPVMHSNDPIKIDLRGSPFQMQVWAALLSLPAGALVSYGDIARALHRPQASRAVGRAVGSNPIAVLIPCHRVIQASGALGGYRWGLGRKAALLAQELGHSTADQ